MAGDLLSSEEPTVTVHLAEGDVGTGRMRGMDGNRGRAVRLSCGDGGVRCERAGDRWRLDGSVDLTAQVYSRRTLDTVAVLAVAEAGGHRLLSSDPGLRLAAVRLGCRFRPVRLAQQRDSSFVFGRDVVGGEHPVDGLDVVERVPMGRFETAENAGYLRAKVERMGHLGGEGDRQGPPDA